MKFRFSNNQNSTKNKSNIYLDRINIYLYQINFVFEITKKLC